MAMFSTIALATRGRIIPISVRRALAMATLGWILVGGTPPTPSRDGAPFQRAKEIVGGRYNGYGELLDVLMKEDDDVLAIIKTWVQCQ